MKKQLTGTFTRSAHRTISHIREINGLTGYYGVMSITAEAEQEARENPVILLDEQLNLQNLVSTVKISSELADMLHLDEYASVEVEVDTKDYSPQTGLRVTGARISGTDSWIFEKDLA